MTNSGTIGPDAVNIQINSGVAPLAAFEVVNMNPALIFQMF
jgi:hypothetical protein